MAKTPSFHEAVGKRLRDLREDHDLTQRELAQALGLTRSAYAYYELGRITMPSEWLVRVARFYHVTTDYLLGLE